MIFEGGAVDLPDGDEETTNDGADNEPDASKQEESGEGAEEDKPAPLPDGSSQESGDADPNPGRASLAGSVRARQEMMHKGL